MRTRSIDYMVVKLQEITATLTNFRVFKFWKEENER